MISMFGRGRKTNSVPDAADFTRVIQRYPALATEEHDRLIAMATEILAEKVFIGAGDFEPSADDILTVAVLAAQPVLELGTDFYSGFHTFILYPAEFVSDLEEMDDDGLVHGGAEIRAGEAWAHGPVVLAMNEVRASAQGEGYNVVAHELAHQIDQLNGDMDGFPPLHAEMDPKRWTEVFSQAWQKLNDQLDHDQEPDLDPYAAESPTEFFAVVSELYFDRPDWIAAQHPALFEQLAYFYRRCQLDC